MRKETKAEPQSRLRILNEAAQKLRRLELAEKP
jgi:hypothetical protein